VVHAKAYITMTTGMSTLAHFPAV